MKDGRLPGTPRWVLIALYIGAFIPVGAVGPYIAVFFQSLGMSLDEIGILAALLALCALVAAPVWGVLTDQRLGARAALAICSLAAAALAVVVGLTDVLLVAAVFALLFTLASAGIEPVLNAITLDEVGDQRSRYALYRVWGSAAFVVGAIGVGVLIDATSLRILFVPLVVSLVVTGLLTVAIPARTVSSAARPLGGLREVIRPAPMAAFLIASFICWSANAMINDFYPIYLVSIDAPTALVGSAFALAAIVEVPILLTFPALVGRLGLGRVMVLGAVFFLARTVVLLVTSDPVIAAAAMGLYGAGSALLLVGGITYVGGLAPSYRAATAQGVFVAVIAGLAQIIGPASAGFIANAAGIPSMFVISAVVSVVGVAAIWIAVLSKRFIAPTGDAEPEVAPAA